MVPDSGSNRRRDKEGDDFSRRDCSSGMASPKLSLGRSYVPSRSGSEETLYEAHRMSI